MDRVPREIIDLIVHEVAYPQGGHILEFGTKIFPNASLKALRLSCKTLSDAATAFLYAEMLVFMDPASLNKLMAISEHAKYCHMIRHVSVFPKHFQGQCLSKAQYENCVQIRSSYGSVYRRYRNQDEFTQSELDEGFLQYKEIHEEFKRLEPRIPGLLKRAFDSFDQLQTVSLGCYDDLDVYEDKEELPFLPPYLVEFHNRTLMSFSGDNTIWCHLHDAKSDMVVLRAAALCKSKLDCLALYTNGRELDFGLLELSDEDTSLVRTLFASLSQLAFSVPTMDCGDFRYYSPESPPFKYLQFASNLTSLRIGGGTSMFSNKPFAYTVRDCYFPKLRSLEFESMGSDEIDLLQLVQRHRVTLATLKLSTVILLSGSWYAVFTGIRGTSFTDFFVSGLWRGSYERQDLCWYSSADDEYLDCPMIPDQPEMLRLLRDYVCMGEPWSEKLPIGLMRDADEEDGEVEE